MSAFSAVWMDSTPFFGQAGRVDEARALNSRPGLSFLDTSGGRVRVRRAPSAVGPKLLIGTDGPNVVEHYDALLEQLAGRADVVVFEPPGTGASTPARGFDFTVKAFAQVTLDVLAQVGARTLVFPCYLGFIGQQVARTAPQLVTRLVMPQTPGWGDLGLWAQGVDPRRLLRTPVVGQAVVATRRRSITRGWYGASTSDRKFRAPFTAAAAEAFDVGGCFCLASLMQGLERSAGVTSAPVSMPSAIVWGSKDRTHRRSDPTRSLEGAELVRFDECGHSPDLEAPAQFAQWLLAWHGAAS